MRIDCFSTLHLGVPVWLLNRNNPSVSERKTKSSGDKSYSNDQHAESCYKMWEKYYSDEAEEDVVLDHDANGVFTLVRCSPVLDGTRKFDQYYWVVDWDIYSGQIGVINKAYDTWKKYMTKELQEEFADDIVMTFDTNEPRVVVLQNIVM